MDNVTESVEQSNSNIRSIFLSFYTRYYLLKKYFDLNILLIQLF